MKATLIALLGLMLSCNSSNAQWRKVADFIDSADGSSELINAGYFIDHPGPPRVGFIGTQPELWKTTDGGISWFKSWANDAPDYSGAFVEDISFKDSMTGWFLYSGGPSVLRTTNGGLSWSPLTVPLPDYEVEGIHYCSSGNRLLVSRDDTAMLVSTDLGNTWSSISAKKNGYFAFSNDSMGIVPVFYYQDTIEGILRTTDAGVTWSLTSARFGLDCLIPLAIPETPTCFAATGSEIKVYRSDDYGQTWRQLYDFGPFQDSNSNRIGPFGNGGIYGDLSHLYLSSDSGIYVSTDEGITWAFSKGSTNLGVCCIYHGEDFAGMSYIGGLWEEDTGVTADVTEQQRSANEFIIYPNPATNVIQITSAIGDISILDPLGRNYRLPSIGNTLDISSLPSGVYFVSDGYSRAKFVKE